MSFSNITIPPYTSVVPVDTRTNSLKVLLLPTVSTNAGQFILFKDYYGTAGTSTFSISTTGTDLIDDINFRYTFSNSFGSMAFVSDGRSSWRTIGLYNGALTPSAGFSPLSTRKTSCGRPSLSSPEPGRPCCNIEITKSGLISQNTTVSVLKE